LLAISRLSNPGARENRALMFEAARVSHRLRNPKDQPSGLATVDNWVGAFKTKRDQILTARCSVS
jgi:hypothetical protein